MISLLLFHSSSFWQGIIFRFKFLMLVTLTCAAMTVTFFILNQVSSNLPIINMEPQLLVYGHYFIVICHVMFRLFNTDFSYFSPGQWRSLALGRLHSPGTQCFPHRDLRHVEPLCFYHHVPLCSITQAQHKQVKRWTTNRSVTFQTNGCATFQLHS